MAEGGVTNLACRHCKGEHLQRHCQIDCSWARCLDCNQVSVIMREDS